MGQAGLTDGLTPVLESIAQRVGQIGYIVNLVCRFIKVVVDTTVLNRFLVRVQNDIATSVVVVTRLANTANIDQQFFAAQVVGAVAFVGRNEFAFRGKHARQMSMTHEAVVRYLAKQNLHLSLVKNVLGENVFVGRVTR